VNRDGRVQALLPGEVRAGMARPAWWVFSELVATMGRGGRRGHVGTAAEAFDRLAASWRRFAGSRTQLGFAGATAAAAVPA